MRDSNIPANEAVHIYYFKKKNQKSKSQTTEDSYTTLNNDLKTLPHKTGNNITEKPGFTTPQCRESTKVAGALCRTDKLLKLRNRMTLPVEESHLVKLCRTQDVKTAKLLSSLEAPRKPAEVSLKEMTNVLQQHHNPRPFTIVQRFKFNTRVRAQEESIRLRAYVAAELTRLTEFVGLRTS
ncbi:hypothetical protein ElyMa_001151800 [Elysia marginata]|uniref:Uncharacterized protein n=1 Tax=Elysia marginata TaxID=1093978 RepID=A0AAV4I0E0_9GAST|nr:hypothetical protein ElyMa_001151800 [Elysia marginata]